MSEAELGGMQVHTVGNNFAIERVAENGTVEPRRMSTVHTQLVSAPCLGEQFDEGAVAFHLYDIIHRYRLLAPLAVDTLTRSVVDIGNQR